MKKTEEEKKERGVGVVVAEVAIVDWVGLFFL